MAAKPPTGVLVALDQGWPEAPLVEAVIMGAEGSRK
jgi:hypothetical protein